MAQSGDTAWWTVRNDEGFGALPRRYRQAALSGEGLAERAGLPAKAPAAPGTTTEE